MSKKPVDPANAWARSRGRRLPPPEPRPGPAPVPWGDERALWSYLDYLEGCAQRRCERAAQQIVVVWVPVNSVPRPFGCAPQLEQWLVMPAPRRQVTWHKSPEERQQFVDDDEPDRSEPDKGPWDVGADGTAQDAPHDRYSAMARRFRIPSWGDQDPASWEDCQRCRSERADDTDGLCARCRQHLGPASDACTVPGCGRPKATKQALCRKHLALKRKCRNSR